MSVWGKRVCLSCGNEFEVSYCSQVTCSPGCRTTRKKETDRQSAKCRYKKIQERLAALSEKDGIIASLREEIERLERGEGVKQKDDGLAEKLSVEKRVVATLKEENLRLRKELNEERQNSKDLSQKNRSLELILDKLKFDNKKLDEKLKAALQKSRSEKERAIQDFKDGNKLQECERLKLKALKLPCGENAVCWLNPPCPKTRGKVKPESFYKTTNVPNQSMSELEDEI